MGCDETFYLVALSVHRCPIVGRRSNPRESTTVHPFAILGHLQGYPTHSTGTLPRHLSTVHTTRSSYSPLKYTPRTYSHSFLTISSLHSPAPRSIHD